MPVVTRRTNEMKFLSLEPEVAGGTGEHTVMDVCTRPPTVTRLYYEFDGWLGDDILETFPCYIISERLKNKLATTAFTGFAIADVEVTKSGEFEDLHPGRELPAFYWLKITGRAGVDDFGFSEKSTLIISEQVLSLLGEFQIDNCQVEAYAP